MTETLRADIASALALKEAGTLTLAILEGDLHPVARLSILPRYREFVDDFLKKMDSNDKNAHAYIADTMAKIDIVLRDEIERARENEEHETEEKERWTNLRANAITDQQFSRQTLREKKEYDSFVRAKRRILDDDTIDVSAKIVWVSLPNREELIKEYFTLLDEAVAGRPEKFVSHKKKLLALVDEERYKG